MTHNHHLFPLFALGIAGNSAGHLQQTGESKAFTAFDDSNKPQALFPFYVANAKEGYLSSMPYSSDALQLPDCPNAIVQMEPELALKLNVSYDQQGKLIDLQPVAMTLINDATYRNAQVTKLAQKKNWGSASKGIASHEISISDFNVGSTLDDFRLCGFHQRDGQWQLCGADVALTEYSYFYQQLQQWLVTQIQEQQDHALFHNIHNLLEDAGHPESIIIAIGATRYSAYGEQHQLLSGDQTAVVLYDSKAYYFEQIARLVEQNNGSTADANEQLIILQQQVI